MQVAAQCRGAGGHVALGGCGGETHPAPLTSDRLIISIVMTAAAVLNQPV